MAKRMVAIAPIGIKEVQRAFKELPPRLQRQTVNRAVRKSLRRLREKVALATPIDTGILATEMERAKIKSLKISKKRRASFVIAGIILPTRDELIIDREAKGYYPVAIEYGFKTRGGGFVPGKRFIRGTVDREKATEQARIGKDINADIMKQLKKKLRLAAKVAKLRAS